MRISDWSSDVCSSDLELWDGLAAGDGRSHAARQAGVRSDARRIPARHEGKDACGSYGPCPSSAQDEVGGIFRSHRSARPICRPGMPVGDRDRRSEEHTSELQSLMRTSYAVFCLKKKKITYTTTEKIHACKSTRK